MRRLWPIVAALVCASLVLAVPAGADHPRKRGAQKLHRLKLDTHADPARALRKRFRRTARVAAVPNLPASWCSTAGGDLSNAPQVRVVYARPTGAANNFAAQANDIQADVAAILNRLATDSASSPRTVRFDLKPCNATELHVDIQDIVLPKTAQQYQDGATYDLLRADLDTATAEAVGARVNYLAYVDGVTEPGASGQADVPLDDTAGRSNGANQGNLFAVLYDPPFGSASADSARRATFLHELAHTLGAVQDSAPNSSGAGHCVDEADIMCYDDDEGGPTQTRLDCPGPAPFTFDELFDCGGDDYWNAAPAAGSYLAANWNTYDSDFLCAAADCDATLTGPEVSLSASGKQLRGEPITFSADAPAGTLFDWDFDGDGEFEGTTGENGLVATVYGQAGAVTPRVRATGPNGAFTLAQTSLNIGEPTLPTPDYIFSPASPLVGQLVTLDASPTQDPDGIITSYSWDLDNDGALDVDNGLQKVLQTRFATTGSRFVWLQVDYALGFSAKGYSINVQAPPAAPGPTLPPPAPGVTVPKIRLKALVARGLALGLDCPRGCRVSASLDVTKKVARKLRLRSRRIGRAAVNAPAGKSRAVLELTRAAKRALRRQRKLAATLTVALSGGSGNLKLTRKLSF